MIHWSVLDNERQAALPRLQFAQAQHFYLAGGTALALQFGHRDSLDFDFFRQDPFDTGKILGLLETAFAPQQVVKTQDERDTLTVLVDEAIKVSFIAYPYPLLQPLVEAPPLKLADVADIGCMKLSAITGRAAMKDYVDLYFILQRIPLEKLLESCSRKLPRLDRTLILKSLVFFDDLAPEPILFASGQQVTFDRVKAYLRDQAKRAS